MRPSKRDELVRGALRIFYRDGFHATGMDKLAAETGISKTSMYKHFRTKEDLILATLRLRDEEFRNRLSRGIDREKTPRAQLLAVFDVLAQWFAEPGFTGCMFIKAAGEYPDPRNPIHEEAARHKRMITDQLAQIAEAAGARDPHLLARQITLLMEGAIVVAHFGFADDPAGDARAAAETLIDAALAGDSVPAQGAAGQSAGAR